VENSKIEWTDHTFNPWIGCQHVSPGCDHCYAETLMDTRYGKVEWGPHGKRKRTSEQNWKKPLKWNKDAGDFMRHHGRRPRVFCASLADVFDNQVPNEWRSDLFALIRECSELDWLLLTKRPENIRKMLPSGWPFHGWPNVWLGVTAENQALFDKRWRILAGILAPVRFVSYEPAIGPLQLGRLGPHPDWLICGGESGAGARVLKPNWIRDIIAECRYLGVRPFFKQWGTYQNNPLVSEHGMPTAKAKARDAAGKGGGMIDGKLVRRFPTAHPCHCCTYP
jgi:protein gp37